MPMNLDLKPDNFERNRTAQNKRQKFLQPSRCSFSSKATPFVVQQLNCDADFITRLVLWQGSHRIQGTKYQVEIACSRTKSYVTCRH